VQLQYFFNKVQEVQSSVFTEIQPNVNLNNVFSKRNTAPQSFYAWTDHAFLLSYNILRLKSLYEC